jgi:hypothetical protein
MRYHKILFILTMIFLFSCRERITLNQIESRIGINIKQKMKIYEIKNLDAIGDYGYVVEFLLLDQQNINYVVRQIIAKENFHKNSQKGSHTHSINEYTSWYQSQSKYVFEGVNFNVREAFILDTITGKCTYSYFEE